MNALGSCPADGSGIPMTPPSATDGWVNSKDSSSAGAT